jgi:hypothetical protein
MSPTRSSEYEPVSEVTASSRSRLSSTIESISSDCLWSTAILALLHSLALSLWGEDKRSQRQRGSIKLRRPAAVKQTVANDCFQHWRLELDAEL